MTFLLIIAFFSGCDSKSLHIVDNNNAIINNAKIKVNYENVSTEYIKETNLNGYVKLDDSFFRIHSINISKDGYENIRITSRKILDAQPIIVVLKPKL